MNALRHLAASMAIASSPVGRSALAAFLLVVLGTDRLHSQAPAAQAAATPAPPPVVLKGKLERVKVHGKSLEGNLLGETAAPEVSIYLPPSYNTDRTRRYPVVYLLHGYTGTDLGYFGSTGRQLHVIAERVFGSGAARDMILVMPNGMNAFGGSMYSNSVTAGDWEGYVADDLVAYMDKNYRTIASRMSRGLAGHSMGGYGTIRIGMKRPDVFSSLYIMSACCLAANRNPRPEAMAEAEAIRTRERAEEAARAPGFGPSVNLASAAAWSPNPANPPLYLDLPVKDGKVRPDIVAKWVANAPLEMLDEHAANLQSYYAIDIEIGDDDPLLAANRQLHDALTRLRIAHGYEEYDGDHTNKVRERIERNLLPFFSKNLAAPANPSSPPPQR